MQQPGQEQQQQQQQSAFDIRLVVDPLRGRIGTDFLFYALNFEPFSQVKLKITNPNNVAVYDNELMADAAGNINYDKIQIQVTQDWVLGEYTFDAIGKSRSTGSFVSGYKLFYLE